jgi:plasmid rolling circle replication initiator protein Rep
LNYITGTEKCQAIIDELNLRKKIHGKLIDSLCNSFEKIEKATQEKAKRMKDCGSVISINQQGKIINANFCKNRYCPICQWRKSRKAFAKSYKVQKRMEQKFNYNYLFLTLTLRNTPDLARGIDDILKSFKSLQDTSQYRKVVKGFIRTLEITYNKESKEWHPHLHIILAVKEDYFKNSELYTYRETWAKLWKQSAKIEYYPQCDIRKINENERENAIAEVSKYMVKPIDINISAETEKIYTSLLKSTFGRRLTSTGGDYRKEFKEVQNETDETDEYLKDTEVLYTYEYNNYNYIMKEVKELK